MFACWCCCCRCAATQRLEGRPIIVASKYFTIPWTNMLLGGGFRFGAQAMADALDTSLQRLGADQVDLYQVHFPFPTYPQEVSLYLAEECQAHVIHTAQFCE